MASSAVRGIADAITLSRQALLSGQRTLSDHHEWCPVGWMCFARGTGVDHFKHRTPECLSATDRLFIRDRSDRRSNTKLQGLLVKRVETADVTPVRSVAEIDNEIRRLLAVNQAKADDATNGEPVH